MAGGIAALLLKADDKNRWSVILHHADGRETTLPSATPAEHLITASEREIIQLRKAEIGYVSQFLSALPRTAAKQHVVSGALDAGFSYEESVKKAEEMLRYFKLPEKLWDIYPNTFSGGEKLRLNLAHAMVKAPRLLLLDEPTASLDNNTKILVKELLLRMKAEGTSMIGIFHDLEFMDGLCDRVYNISDGSFISGEK